MIALYRWLLRLAAPPLARDYGDAMEDALAEKLRERRGWRRIALWCRELAMLPKLAWIERWSARARQQRRQRQHLMLIKAGPMETLVQDFRQAARRLLRSPAFSAAAVLTLALAIAANTAIFAVVERVVLNPLPYPQSDRLLNLDHGSATLRVSSGMNMTQGMYFLYRDRATSLESVAAYTTAYGTLTAPGEAERIRLSSATPSLGTVLRVTPLAGRWFTADEGVPGGRATVVLSHDLWQQRFGGQPSAVGQTITLEGQSREVVGIMPAGFAFPEPGIAAWTNEQLNPARGFGLFTLLGVARLRDGATVDGARTELQRLIGDIAKAFPNDPIALGNIDTRIVFSGQSLKETLVGGISRALWILLAAVGAVLLIACANIANLFLVRSELRQREIAIRRALGGGRAALARFFLTESGLLSLVGGVLGLAIGWAAVKLLVQLAPPTLPRLHEIGIDLATIGYAALLSFVSAIAFGVLPIWRGASNTALHESGRGNTSSRQRHHVRHMLLGGQVALALVLLVTSGLMVRSVLNLRAIDPGFNPDAMATFTVGLPERGYPTIDNAVQVHHRIIEQLSALPGVTSVAASTCLPFAGGCTGNTIAVEGRDEPVGDGRLPPLAMFRAVTGGYFEMMGMRLRRGRGITRDDVERKEPVVVLGASLAATIFGDEDPIGRRIASREPPRGGMPPVRKWLEVVGVVSDVPVRALNEPRPPALLYTPLSLARGAETPITAMIAPSAATVSYAIRASASPLDTMPAVRHLIRGIDDRLALAQVMTMQATIDRASAAMTFTMTLLAIGAIGALALGIVGIYGVTSYIVTQRTNEIGVRLALGAEPDRVAAQIVRQGGAVALAGIVLGLGAAFAGGRLIASVLYGVSPRDPVIFGAMAVLLLIVALVACWIPARRAARLSPTIALRGE